MLAWSTLGKILRDGGSWSGHERNCCFLNTRDTRFADVSSVLGLDQDSDSRAIASVDWDQDGDLDLWVSNRTAPRVRYLQNDAKSENGFLALRLQGASSSRDAIGARVILETSDPALGPSRSIRTVRAGDGYLAQSSKWIHFGLGQDAGIKRVGVQWPHSDTEWFTDFQANTRYLLVQGSGTARPVVAPPRSVKLAASTDHQEVPRDANVRIVPHRRLPLPSLPLIDLQGRSSDVDTGPRQHVLVTLWATWCQPCLIELQEFANHESELAAADIRWLPINIDDYEIEPAERLPKIRWFLTKANVPARGGLATSSLVESLDIVQRVLTTKQGPLPVPCSFLLDSSNHLMAVYKGAVSPDQVTKDVVNLSRETSDPRDHAVPFPGLWGTGLFPPDLMAIPKKLIEISRAPEALAYLNAHVSTDQLSPAITVDDLSTLYAQIGQQLVQQGELEEAVIAFEKALLVEPQFWAPRAGLAAIYQRQGRIAQAVVQHRMALQISPGHPLSTNNLAWILATFPDPKIRIPGEAVQLAEQLCRQSNFAQPTALDTLAAAQAAAGHYQQAVETAQKAVTLSTSAGRTAAAERMRQRLKLYQSGRPYFEDIGVQASTR